MGENSRLDNLGKCQGILLIIGVTQIGGVCGIISGWTFHILSETISFNIRRDFFKSLIEKDVAFFDDDDHSTGELSKYYKIHVDPTHYYNSIFVQ